MILVCPSCETRYFADDSALGAEGRRVRCASCGHSWFARPEGAPASAAQSAAPDSGGLTREQVERLRQSATANAAGGGAPHAEFRARETARRRRARRLAAVLGWSTGAFLFAAMSASAVVFREQVAAAWPQTASAYKLVGLSVNRYGLELTGVAARRSFSGTTPVLTVTGAAVNATDRVRAAPELRFSLRNEAGEEIQSWTDRLPVQLIPPGASVEFSSSLTSPPVETYGLKVTFTGRPAMGKDDGAEVGHEQITEETPADAHDGHEEGAHSEPSTSDAPADPLSETEPEPAPAESAPTEATADPSDHSGGDSAGHGDDHN